MATRLFTIGTLVASLTVAAACGGPTVPTPVLTADTFTGILQVNGADARRTSLSTTQR